MKIGFLGAGKMATAIAGGLLEKNVWPASELVAMDISPQARHTFTAETKVECVTEAEYFAEQIDILIAAVKPQNFREAFEPLKSRLTDKLVISIAAGTTLESIEACCGHRRIIRVMPNTPARIGKGVSLYASAEELLPEDKAIVEKIFSAVGIVKYLPEAKLNAATALSGSGPAYIFEVIQSLTEAGTAAGLDHELAQELTVQTIIGSAYMVKKGVDSPEKLRQAVASPGGTTEAALKVLEKAEFRKIWEKALKAALDRAQELGNLNK